MTKSQKPHRRRRQNSQRATTNAAATAMQLSNREHQLITLLIAGLSVKGAAAVLGISRRTAEGYLDRVKRRFGYTRLIPLIAYLIKNGLVE